MCGASSEGIGQNMLTRTGQFVHCGCVNLRLNLRKWLAAALLPVAAAAPVMLSVPGAAFGEEWTATELSGQRLFIGLTKGNLQEGLENHLKSYVALRGLVKKLADIIDRETISVIHIGDLAPWGDSEAQRQREMLVRRGYTHYLIAIPTIGTAGSDAVNVTWRIGKVRERQQPREWKLRYETRISVPGAGQKSAFIKRKGAIQGKDAIPGKDPAEDERQEAEVLENNLHGVLPETKPDRLYAVDCIDDRASLPADIPLETMEGLSNALAIPPWKSARDRFNRALARKLCEDQLKNDDEVELRVGGRLQPLWWHNEQRVLANIDLISVLRQRKLLATSADYTGERGDDDDRPQTLKEFCFQPNLPSYHWVPHLARYIQAHGLKIPGAGKYGDEFICRP